ncbi:FHA domain-containing protein [Polaromonas naphthalenivorans]|uniref:FHA domain containing protein n=1 Tax=Polaromonas naphthalenivorans (strain CJ2) TaxID=365044 RepID=A1VUB6_POLNA|nr:FHA domain-containing protein [Polaromonas naphthalenivorans]ABM39244.1 FHA domain containing protein [Polaromonas naphthalenivorans CJ2]
MPKMIISLDGVVLKEVQLTKDRTSLGRRPYNDIVIDNMAVSGEHAVLQMSGNEGYIEDLNSTNGTYVNGKTVKKQQLHHDDIVEIGKYKIQYVDEANAGASAVSGAIRVMSGAAAGREMALVKAVTTLGKPGVAVATITKGPRGFVIAHVDGASQPMLNGVAVGIEAVALRDGDRIELAGAQMQFVVH